MTADVEDQISGSDDRFTCDVCGFVAKNNFGLTGHKRKHNKEIPVAKATKPSSKELKQVQDELATNIKTVGQVLHPVLLNAKILKIQNPDLAIRIPGTKVEAPVPNLDTHLAYTLISRSEVTAKLLVDYAADNATLLRWLMTFNSWFKGGEGGLLIGSYAVATVSTLGISNGIISTGQQLLLPDVLPQVEAENQALREQVQQMQEQLRAYRTDERGMN